MAVLLRIQNVFTYIEGHFPVSEVDKALSYYRQGFFMSKLFNSCLRCKIKINPKTGRCNKCGKPRIWDGKAHLLLGQNQTPYFPTGCLGIVLDVITRNGLQASFKDERGSGWVVSPEAAHNVILRDPKDPSQIRTLWQNQTEAVEAAIRYERGVVQSPTSAGKTTIMAALAKIYPLDFVILIHNTSIAKQLQTEIQAMIEEPVGLIKGGQWETQRVTVAMVQSLIDKLGLSTRSKKEKLPPLIDAQELVQNTGVLLLDEAHHSSSDTWFTLCKQFTKTRFRFGLTGTPFMRGAGDDILLVGATGGLIYEVAEQELIDAGLIARPIIHLYKINSPYIEDELPYDEVYKRGVVNNNELNDLAATMISGLYENNAQILVLCEHLDHIDNIAKRLKDLEFEILTGESKLEDREEAQKLFKAGKLKVILASKIFDEGISLENIDVIFRMGLLKTEIKSKQQTGRGQRIKKNKPNVVHLIDFIHDTHRYLKEHSKAHYNFYKSLNYEIIEETEPLAKI